LSYPAAPPSRLRANRQDLVRTDDSLPCLGLLSFHERPGASIGFLDE